ncbi:MAG: hypothetical protein NC926_01335 [Candidatus Omnitrophica bacterium]|nr:hypothetical protein [Candidatus Omnitrophota bacterium]
MIKHFFFLFLTFTLFSYSNFPSYVKEKSFLLENFDTLNKWIFPENVDLKIVEEGKEKFIKVNYKFKKEQKEIEFIYNFSYPGFNCERIFFKFKGDGSKNKIYVWGEYKNQWYPFVFFELKKNWQKIEFAPTPCYFFYKDFSKIKFVLKNFEKNENQGEFILGGIYSTTPEIFFSKFKTQKNNHFNSKIFNTWGALSSLEDISKKVDILRELGINLHIFPISFEIEDKNKLNVELNEICEKIKIVKQKGLLVGISFYNTPSSDIIKKYENLLLKNENNEYYSSGGCFFSIWHPVAKKIWKKHIVYALNYLKKKKVLNLIDVVFLCPGEESEISYNWNHIWAFDEYAIRSYQSYLRKLYQNSIKKLNEDWLTNKNSFEEILPPEKFYPDREHWTFLNFYRWSMLKWCYEITSYVKEVFSPKYFLWLPHTVDSYPQRFYSARFPHFYIWYLKKFGIIHFAHISALDWHTQEDIKIIKPLKITIIGEVDVIPTVERLEWTFQQSKKYELEGVYIGVAENLFENNQLNKVGEKCKVLIEEFKKGG